MRLPAWLRRKPRTITDNTVEDAAAYVTMMLAKFLDAVELSVKPVGSEAEAREDLHTAGAIIHALTHMPGSQALLAPAVAMIQCLILTSADGGIPTEVWLVQLRKLAAEGIDSAEKEWKDANL